MQIICTICSGHGDLWKDLETLSVTKCGHIFHKICLMSQISLQSKAMIECPMLICNKKIKQANIIQIDLKAIDKRNNNKQINKPADCFLCNDPVTDPKNISVTKCGHIYHFNCLAAFVRPKANACFVPSCKKKITQATITQIQPIEGASDVTEDNQALSEEELLQDKEEICQQYNDQQIKLDLERECLMNMLDDHSQLTNNEITLNQKMEELKQQNKALGEEMEALEKDRNDAKKETAIWEMSFKYLQENFKDTELMIPNEKTLSVMKENEKLKLHSQEMERERNDAKKETAIWEMSFLHLQDKFKDTDMMIPNEATLELIKENETLKICIQDLGRELVSTKKDVKSAQSLRADFSNYVEENLILKNENEQMKRDLKTVKEDMTKLDSTITDVVMRHSQENGTLNEFSDSLLEENTKLTELNENLQKENNKLKEIVNTLQNENNKLHELSDTQQKDNNKLNESNHTFLLWENIRLNELNETLQKENNKLHELQKGNNKLNEPKNFMLRENIRLNELKETLKKENNKLHEQNDTLEKGNNKLNESNQSLLKENTRLNELNETLKKEKNKYSELVLSVQKEKRDFQWGQINRRRTCSNSFQVTNKRRASEMYTTHTEKQASTDLLYKEAVQEGGIKEEVINKESIKEVVVNKESIKEVVVNKESINEEAENEEPDIKRNKLELDNEAEDGASNSSSRNISQAINEIEDS